MALRKHVCPQAMSLNRLESSILISLWESHHFKRANDLTVGLRQSLLHRGYEVRYGGTIALFHMCMHGADQLLIAVR